MKKFIVDEKLFEQYENLSIGIVVVKGIDNTRTINNIDEMMDEVKGNVKNKFEGVELANYPIIRTWRDIYKSFGEKKSRSSVEALIRRTVNGNDLSSINPLVDLYNIISLKHELPCGGEDLDKVDDDIILTYADGNEDFLSLGETEIEHPNEGEIVYKSGNMIMCRNFNYRESDITKLTEDTKNAVLVIENILDSKESLKATLDELATLVNDHLGGTYEVAILDKDNNEIIL